jgi:hypothetical protein
MHAAFALLCAVWTAALLASGSAAGAILPGVGAVVFGTSALRAPKRLERQVARLAQARDRNAHRGGAGTTGTA